MQQLDNYFQGTNAETAYMLDKYCGVRINECYGLKWDKIDLENGIITIDRQMQYQEGLIKLVSLKTRNAKRKIYMCSKLKKYFENLVQQQKKYKKELKAQRQQNQTFIQDIKREYDFFSWVSKYFAKRKNTNSKFNKISFKNFAGRI